MRHSARKVLTGVMSNSSRGSRVARINKCVGGDARAKITIRIEKPQLVKYTEEILYLLLFEMYNLTQKIVCDHCTNVLFLYWPFPFKSLIHNILFPVSAV